MTVSLIALHSAENTVMTHVWPQLSYQLCQRCFILSCGQRGLGGVFLSLEEAATCFLAPQDLPLRVSTAGPRSAESSWWNRLRRKNGSWCGLCLSPVPIHSNMTWVLSFFLHLLRSCHNSPPCRLSALFTCRAQLTQFFAPKEVLLFQTSPMCLISIRQCDLCFVYLLTMSVVG